MPLKICLDGQDYWCGVMFRHKYYTLTFGNYDTVLMPLIADRKEIFKKLLPKPIFYNRLNGFPITSDRIELLRLLVFINDENKRSKHLG